MRIGLAVGDVRGPTTLDGFIDQVRDAAASGFAAAWASQALGWDALTALAVAGVEVPDIPLGVAVVPTPQRHPLLLASQALTVQAAVGGRLTLGVGAGIGAMVSGMFGLPVDRPAPRMREYLAALGPLLRGEPVDHHGATLTASGAVAVPDGVPAPPVLLAALAPRMLRLAGELADGTVTWMTGPKTLADHIIPTITRAASAAGRKPPRIVAGFLVCATDRPDDVRSRIATDFAVANQVPEYRATLAREAAAGPHDVALVGPEPHLAQALAHLADIGVTDLIAAPYGTPAEQSQTQATLTALLKAP